ncbi:hypothetical protein UFOVP306_50 [uncultured Caudovirales phage]|uniref:Uncharacterized protein n=1 Tax=uncultured Caudovirales phage TaxID=2100421 RepID=A0A6J5LR17_9CAUD|nr:hypothetical protein UFOVP306_50 [uncultured Caudovirales phage]
MSKVLKEVTVISGQYTNAKGEKKNRYTKIGSIIDTKNGDMLKLDVTPLMDGGWNGWAYLNEPRTADEFKEKPDFDKDIPF